MGHVVMYLENHIFRCRRDFLTVVVRRSKLNVRVNQDLLPRTDTWCRVNVPFQSHTTTDSINSYTQEPFQGLSIVSKSKEAELCPLSGSISELTHKV
jgi:hypothetical protein